MFDTPTNALGADLLWWRTRDGMRTVATLLWGRDQPFADAVHLQACLFDEQGQPLITWRIDLSPDQPVFIDSAVDGPWRIAQGTDGMLALYACTAAPPTPEALDRYNRLFPLLEWHRANGGIATLHSDQTIRPGRERVQLFTEIVVLESDEETNAIVLLNGESPQMENALELTFRNALGEEQSAFYPQAMAPFTVHRIAFAELMSGLAKFSAGQPLVVSGRFASRGLFSRPYIETTGQRWGVYHAGDVYRWSALPYVAHALIGGEVNPAAVLHDEHTRTYVNLLHSHGTLEADLPIDAVLFDFDGRCVARRAAWLITRRHGLARVDVADLLPDPNLPFRGHIALSFAPARGVPVPGHLQALMEYRRPNSVARVMTWSDEWNSRVRLARRDRSLEPPRYRSYFRVDAGADVVTELAITNAGHNGYDRSAEVRATYRSADGRDWHADFSLTPFATRTATSGELFDGSADRPPMDQPGIVLLESSSDLACIAYTHQCSTGALAAEHFLWLQSEHEGELLLPAGS
ncbi:MAG: hypothetical protein EPN91_06090 [Salinibacterium sp.]|nr:MAG: hypothetical protein EPN91_06090 [Salinibacterium sp.]